MVKEKLAPGGRRRWEAKNAASLPSPKRLAAWAPKVWLVLGLMC